MPASEAVAEVSVREPTAVSVEAVAEAKMATVEAGAKAKAKAAVIRPVVAVIRPVVGVVAVVAPAVCLGIVAGIRITGRDSANHSGRDGGAGIVAVSVAVSVSPNVMAMAGVAMRNVLVRAVRDTRVSDTE